VVPRIAVLILIVLIPVGALCAFEGDIEEGIYVNRSHRDPARNAYLAISHVYEDEFFVLHADPFRGFSYAAIGTMESTNVLKVELVSTGWFVEFRDDGTIWHNMTIRVDPTAREYRKVVGEADSWHYTGLQESIGLESFSDHIRSLQDDSVQNTK